MNSRQIVQYALAAAAVLPPLLVLGCAHVKVDPIEVKTIHIQHDVTIGVDKSLEDFFAFQEREATQPSATQATTQAAAASSGTASVPSTQPATSPSAPGDIQ